MRKSPLLLLLLGASTAWCVPVEKWVQTTRTDFQNGKAKGTAVLALGQVTLAPQLKPLMAKTVPHVWHVAADERGTLYVAAGLPARVLRVRDGKTDDFFTAPATADLEILSVAVGPKGNVYAAAAPSGALYRIGRDGKAAKLYAGPDPYIWAMAVAPDGSVLAATGPHGKLLKIAPDGKATTRLQADAKHILCLHRMADGSAYAGTDAKGLVYHVQAKGPARVVYDAAESDVRALAQDAQGNVYFATAATSAAPAPSSTPTSTSPGIRIVRSSTPSAPRPATVPSAPGSSMKATNSIYRLAPDGTVTKLVSAPGVAYYALAWHQGRLYAGTGNDGKLFRVDGRTAVQLADLDESQVMAFAAAGGKLVMATANPGQVYQMTAPHVASGTMTSEVYDTTSQSQWGQIAWQAAAPKGAKVTLATRTGNTSRPDASWTPWSGEYTKPGGQAVVSPTARFIQYRATLASAGSAAPVLDEVVIAYARANEAPQVTAVKIGKPPKPRTSVSSAQPGQSGTTSSSPNGHSVNTRKQSVASQTGPAAERIRIAWSASDANKDGLYFSVCFRGEDETTWKTIRDRLTTSYVDWDTEAVPDGLYRFRVVASDARTNPPERALEGQLITEAFVVDNTPPAVSPVKANVARDRSASVAVSVADKTSRIDAAEYSVDAGNWTPLVPADGIFDAATEAIEFKTKALDPGEHTIVVRARDEAGNSGAAKAVITVK